MGQKVVEHINAKNELCTYSPPSKQELAKGHARQYYNMSIRPGYFSLYNLPKKDDESIANRLCTDNAALRSELVQGMLPESNATGGVFSDKAKQRINRSIDWLMEVSPRKAYIDPISHRKRFMKVNFITLTLPAPQMHNDNTIKQVCLNQFLTELRQGHKCKHYVWGAESQSNGNIHFHITTNTYVHWGTVRKIWNRCIDKLGYIEEYGKVQRQWHAEGFKPRPEQYKTWSQEKQKRAYENGYKNNWSQPNSTDVHAVRNVKNIAGYLAKHYSKQQKNNLFTLLQQGKRGLEACYNPSQAIGVPEDTPGAYRVIQGNLWGLSQSISKLSAAVIEISHEVLAEIDAITQRFASSVRAFDYNMNVYVPVWKWSKLIDGIMANAFYQYKVEKLV